MITASDFIDLDLEHSRTPSEREKGIQLIETLTNQPESVKAALVEEFIQIVQDQKQPLVRRVQAARMLAHQADRLGIVASNWVAQSILQAIEETFFPTTQQGMKSALASKTFQEDLGQLEVFFLEYLVGGAYRIDKVCATQKFEKWVSHLPGDRVSNRIRQAIQKMTTDASGET